MGLNEGGIEKGHLSTCNYSFGPQLDPSLHSLNAGQPDQPVAWLRGNAGSACLTTAYMVASQEGAL